MLTHFTTNKLLLTAGAIIIVAVVAGLWATSPWPGNQARANDSEIPFASQPSAASEGANDATIKALKATIPGFYNAGYSPTPLLQSFFKIYDPREDEEFSCARPVPALHETSRCLVESFYMGITIDFDKVRDLNTLDTDAVIRNGQMLITAMGDDVCPNDRMILARLSDPKKIGTQGKYRTIPYRWLHHPHNTRSLFILVTEVTCIHPHDFYRHWAWPTAEYPEEHVGHHLMINHTPLRSHRETGYVETDLDIRKRMGMGLYPHPADSIPSK